MAKTISVAGLGHGGASGAIRDAQEAPVLVSKENRPVAWIISAEKLAEVAAANGKESASTYQRMLELIAVEQFHEGAITLGSGAKLCGMSIHDFIDFCAKLQVPVLRDAPEDLEEEVNRLDLWLRQLKSDG